MAGAKAMLNEISWSQYCIAICMLAGAYYVVSFLLLYSQEIKQFLKGSGKADHSEEDRTKELDDVLGTTRPAIKSTARPNDTKEDSQLTRSSGLPNDPGSSARKEDEGSDEDLLTGTVADLLEEIKAHLKTHEGWNKDEMLPAIRELLIKYPQLIGTVYQESISLFIANSCSEYFHWELDPEEVQPLWT